MSTSRRWVNFILDKKLVSKKTTIRDIESSPQKSVMSKYQEPEEYRNVTMQDWVGDKRRHREFKHPIYNVKPVLPSHRRHVDSGNKVLALTHT